MMTPPGFVSDSDYVVRLGDDTFWSPYITEVLRRHDLDDRAVLWAGSNPTYPTFLCGDVVVKLFGYASAWRRSFAGERAAMTAVADDREIAAPGLLAQGRLFDDPDAAWPYLVTSRVAGVASCDAALSKQAWHTLAEDLGKQVRRIHALSPAGMESSQDWHPLDVAAAAEQSSLPHHLVAQVDRFIAQMESFDCVFVHGDLCANHVFVDQGCLTGIIDWGDALATDRHYELIQLYRDMFACDKALFRTFLDASDWPVTGSFTRQALGMALYRQAIGLEQHRTMDVLEPIAARFPLHDVGSLDELALELFDV